MAQIKIYYEPETELLTVFWQNPRKIKDPATDEPIGVEILSYELGSDRLDRIGVEMGENGKI